MKRLSRVVGVLFLMCGSVCVAQNADKKPGACPFDELRKKAQYAVA